MNSYKLPKSSFKKSVYMMPLDGPGKIKDIVRGPSYIWSILNDKRIL